MNATQTTPSENTQMMFFLGSMVTAFASIAISLGQKLMDYLVSIIFFQLSVDEDRTDSAEPVVVSRLYQHILNNQTFFQGWKARISQNTPGEKTTDIKNHTFVLQDGGCFFWISWYANYTSGWATGELTIIGIRPGRSRLINLINDVAIKPEKLIKYQCSTMETWKRSEQIHLKTYLDGNRVLDETKRCVENWEKKNNPFISQCNNGCFLLWGPHGTFKTSLVKLIAVTYKMNLFVIAQNDLREDIFGKMMETLQPGSIVLFDDIDNDEPEIYVPQRGRRRSGKSMKSVIKTVMDGTVNLPKECLYFMCCNNTELDADIKSRFTPYYMGYADCDWRKSLFHHVFPDSSDQLREQFSQLYQAI